MRRRLALAIAAAALTAGRPALAQTAPEGPRLSAVQAWAAKAAGWVEVQQSTFREQERAFLEVNLGAGKAMAFARDGKTAEGAAWALQWAPARRLQLASLRSQAHRASSAAPPLPPELEGVDQLRTQEAALREVSGRQAEIIRAGLDLADEIVDLAQKAASGDQAAARTLRQRQLELEATELRGENVLIDAANSTLEANDPQGDIGQAARSGNLAMIDLLDAQKAAAAGDAAAGVAAGGRMRAHALQMQAAAGQASTDASLDLADLRANRSFGGPAMAGRLSSVVDSFSESALVEAQIAGVLLTVAARLEKGEPPSSPAIQQALAGMNRLVQRRIELDRQRKRILAGQAP